MKVGTVFQATPIEYDSPDTLYRTASMYQYGPDLETIPKMGELYIMCRDGSIKSLHNLERPIGWELIHKESEGFFYRVTQHGHQPRQLFVTINSHLSNNIPAGNGFIGSKIDFCFETMERGEN